MSFAYENDFLFQALGDCIGGAFMGSSDCKTFLDSFSQD